jgi:predicted sugar kinase
LKRDFEPFSVGTVLNPLVAPTAGPACKSVCLEFPSRLCSMSLDSSGLSTDNRGVYRAGEILFAVNLCRCVTVTLLGETDRVNIHGDVGRPVLVRHAVGLMRQSLGVRDGLSVEVRAPVELKHCGLGSSSATIAAVAAAINELYGCPLSDQALARYLAQNHGEEIDGDDDHLVPVQCIGGSGVAGLYHGGLLVIAGECTVIGALEVPPAYRIVLAVPHDLREADAATLMREEQDRLPRFAASGETHAYQVAYELLHQVLPAMVRGDLGAAGDLIYRHRFQRGSIENCSFMHPRMLAIGRKARTLKERGVAPVVSVSSVGPAFFAVTTDPQECCRLFTECDMRCMELSPYNTRYRVLGRM